MYLNHGDLEMLILNVIWDNTDTFQSSMSVNQVWDKLNRLNIKKKWAYTTIKTVLDRLTEKGLLNKIKNGKKYDYVILISRNEMAEKALRKVANEYFASDFLKMADLVKELSYEEEKTLVHVYR